MAATLARPGWADLPLDLLGHVCNSLCDAADLVRFHAVCRSWRDTAGLTPATRPALLPTRPWILAPCNGIIFQYPYVNLEATTPKPSCHHRRYHNQGTSSTGAGAGDMNWVASADGKAVWLFTGGPDPKLRDLLTGAVTPLPPFPDGDDIEKPRGIVYGDGTILLYSLSPGKLRYFGHWFKVAILHPGNGDTAAAAWMVLKERLLVMGSHCFGATYHRDGGAGGTLLLWIGVHCYALTFNNGAGEYMLRTRLDMDGGDFICDYNYYLLSRGELLWTFVIVEPEWYHSYDHGDPPPRALSLTVRALKPVGGSSNKMQWVPKDGRSLSDRVMFLGSPASFTMDVAQLSGGGYAYFVFKQGVYSYNLLNGKAKLVTGQDRLGPNWGADKVFMWLQPQPTIAPIQEIRERLKASNQKDVVY